MKSPMTYPMRTTDRHKLTLFLGLLLVLFCLGATVKAQLPSPPNPPRLVNDYTSTLTAQQINVLEHKLVAYNDSTSTQILVLLVDDLQGYDIEQYATEIGHSWGVGQKGKNNGVIAPNFLWIFGDLRRFYSVVYGKFVRLFAVMWFTFMFCA